MAFEVKESSDTLFLGFSRLYAHLSYRRRWQLGLVLILMLVGAIAELATLGAVLPFLTLIADPARAADYPMLQAAFSVFGWTNPSQILLPATLMFAFSALCAGAVRLLLAWVSQRFVFRVGYDLGIQMYRGTLYQPYKYHVSRNTSETIAGINKIQLVTSGILMAAMQAVIGMVISLFIFAALVAIDPLVASAAFLGFGSMYLVVTYMTREKLRTNSVVIANAQTQRVKTVQEGLGGIRDVLIDQAQLIYLDKFRRVDSALRDSQAVNAFIEAAPRFVIESLGMVLISILAFFLMRDSDGLSSTLPVLGALALGAQRLMPLLQRIYNGWARITGNRQILFDVLAFLDLPIHDRYVASIEAAPLPFTREITIKEVSYRYSEDRPLVLDNVTLSIKKGARVGFVGKTGSGKSTVVDLAMGLLEPTLGEVRIDGKLLTEDNVQHWQSQIAHVPQAIYLADTTVAQNIAFGVPAENISVERVQDAAHRAKLATFIETLPNGYETVVGERGIRLSGGQRQRIGIARALYKQASVLVFDEATSALDNDTEAAIMTEIGNLDRDLTVLIIAHRLSTVAICDKVLKLDSGCVDIEVAQKSFSPAAL